MVTAFDDMVASMLHAGFERGNPKVPKMFGVYYYRDKKYLAFCMEPGKSIMVFTYNHNGVYLDHSAKEIGSEPWKRLLNPANKFNTSDGW